MIGVYKLNVLWAKLTSKLNVLCITRGPSVTTQRGGVGVAGLKKKKKVSLQAPKRAAVITKPISEAP